MQTSRQLVLLCDLDGVLRSFDRVGKAIQSIEQAHGLPDDALLATAFTPELLKPEITGQSSHDEWVESTRTVLTARYGTAAANELIDCWTGDFGDVVPDVLSVTQELRSRAWRVVLATNATTRLPEDLAHLGLANEFDAVANSSNLGFAKPDRGFYAKARSIANVPAEQILFIDDKASNVVGAVEYGMAGAVFENTEQMRTAALNFADALL